MLTFQRDILKVLARTEDPQGPLAALTPPGLLAAGIQGPLENLRADVGSLRRSGLIEEAGMVGGEYLYRITAAGVAELNRYYAGLRREAEVRIRS